MDTMDLRESILHADTMYWAILIAACFLIWLLAQKLRKDGYALQARVLSWGSLLVLICGGGILGILRFKDHAPNSRATMTKKETVVHEGMLEGANRLADATRKVTVDPKTGKKSVEMRYNTRLGWQPLMNFPIDMGKCAEAGAFPAWVLHKYWRSDPGAFVAEYKKAYDEMGAQNPVALRIGREPFYAAREAMAFTGQRVLRNGQDGKSPFLAWVNANELTDSVTTVEEISIPYRVVLEFDRVCWTLTDIFGADAYPYVTHLAADFLDSEGVGWMAAVPGHEAEFADSTVRIRWDPTTLSDEGNSAAIYWAIHDSGPLPEAMFWLRKNILADGCEGTPFQESYGGTLGQNLGALLWGKDFEVFFKGDAILAARVAAFLAANPKARIDVLPDPDNKGLMAGLIERNRKHVALVANTWFDLGGKTHPDKQVQEDLSLGWGEDDPSAHWIAFMKEYTAQAMPLNGKFEQWQPSDMQIEVRRLKLLPNVPDLLEELFPTSP